MSAAIAFDTHRFVKKLTANGFTEQQAEVLAREQADLLDSNLATKADIASVKADLELKIEASKVELLKRMLTAMIAQGALIVTLIKPL